MGSLCQKTIPFNITITILHFHLVCFKKSIFSALWTEILIGKQIFLHIFMFNGLKPNKEPLWVVINYIWICSWNQQLCMNMQSSTQYEYAITNFALHEYGIQCVWIWNHLLCLNMESPTPREYGITKSGKSVWIWNRKLCMNMESPTLHQYGITSCVSIWNHQLCINMESPTLHQI